MSLVLKSKNRSFYTILGFVVVVVTLFAMGAQAWIDYSEAKKRLNEQIQKDAMVSLEQIKKSIAPYIHAYSMAEYLKIVENEMGENTIFAVVIDDYYMGSVIGIGAYTSGKIRDENWQVIPYNPTSDLHTTQIQEQYFSTSQILGDQNNKPIAKISVYSSDKFMDQQLKQLIVREVSISFVFLLVYLIVLYFVIKKFLLKPLDLFIQDIQKKDQYNIPQKIQINESTSEIYTLTSTMDTMIQLIQNSRKKLQEQKKSWR